jgi:hypothetical protein
MFDTLPRLRLAQPDDPPAGPRKSLQCLVARLDVEHARKFLLELHTAAASTSPLLALFQAPAVAHSMWAGQPGARARLVIVRIIVRANDCENECI